MSPSDEDGRSGVLFIQEPIEPGEEGMVPAIMIAPAHNVDCECEPEAMWIHTHVHMYGTMDLTQARAIFAGLVHSIDRCTVKDPVTGRLRGYSVS